MVYKYEGLDSPYNVNEVDPSLIAGLSKGIAAFKIRIIKVEAKAKLSQNHPPKRQELVIEKLDSSLEKNNQQIAALMRKNLEKI